MFLVFVVCVGFVSSFSCLCSPCVCLSFFLYWFLSFLCFFVSSLFLAVVGFFIGVLVPVCAVCLRWVCLLYCFRVLVFVSVVGGVCMCLMYVPLSCVCVFCVLFFI